MPKWVRARLLVDFGTMIFNVYGLMMGPTGATRYTDLDGEFLETEYGDFWDISGQAQLLNTGKTILATAEVSGYTTVSCARCLDPAHIELWATIEQEYFPANAAQMDTGLFALEPEEQAFRIDERNFVDLGEAVRQSLTSTMPMAPLCREDCEGLCPRCSARLNSEVCNCEETTENSQWSALAEIALESRAPAG